MDDNIEIQVADSVADKEAVYRLRYQVFTEELGDSRYANHQTRKCKDEDDLAGSKVIVAKSKGMVVASFRVKTFREHKFIAADNFRFELLASILTIPLETLSESVCCLDRCIIATGWRGKGLARMLQQFAEQEAVKNDCTVMVGITAVDNKDSSKVFAKLGFVKYPVVDTYKGMTCQCIYKILVDQLIDPA